MDAFEHHIQSFVSLLLAGILLAIAVHGVQWSRPTQECKQHFNYRWIENPNQPKYIEFCHPIKDHV